MSLHLLAQRLGVATGYTGARREQVAVPDSTIVAVIRGLGHDTDAADWIDRALAHLDASDTARLVEPVLIAWDGHLDQRAAFARLGDRRVTLRDDEGRDVGQLLDDMAPLPLGYFHLTVDDDPSHALVISAPHRLDAPTGRQLCAFAPLYALRPPETSRYADLRELDDLVTWVAANGGRGVLTLPLLAGFFDEPAEPSPYAPASRIAWNELYAIVDRPSIEARDTLIDYVAAYRATRLGIEQAAAGLGSEPFQASEFLQFLAAHPAIAAYARFRAAGEQYGRDWRHWPERLRHGEIQAGEVDATRVRYHCVAQWLMHTQLAEVAARARALGVTFGLDLAVGTHPDAYDVWAHQRSFASGLSIGAPPDEYFPGGQTWGFPPPIPERARADGYRDLRAALRHHLGVASFLRVDHVMGLLRLFWIPDGSSPAHGTYVSARLDEQLAVVCLEARLAGATIVGENLGLVPAEIDEALRTHGILGLTVAYGALEDPTTATQPLTAPAHDVATFGTHDMATFAGFVCGDDLADRVALGLGNPDDARAHARRRMRALDAAAAARGIEATPGALFHATVVELAASAAPWMVLAVEDLWGERRPQNVPGTSTERPNWRRRFAYTLGDVPEAARNLLHQAAAERAGGVRSNDAPS